MNIKRWIKNIGREYKEGEVYEFPIYEIKIKKEFQRKQPGLEKMIEKDQYYIENQRFKEIIVLDENRVLQDGYTTYLLAKKHEFNFAPVMFVYED